MRIKDKVNKLIVDDLVTYLAWFAVGLLAGMMVWNAKPTVSVPKDIKDEYEYCIKEEWEACAIEYDINTGEYEVLAYE